jgi:hypothetical protein
MARTARSTTPDLPMSCACDDEGRDEYTADAALRLRCAKFDRHRLAADRALARFASDRLLFIESRFDCAILAELGNSSIVVGYSRALCLKYRASQAALLLRARTADSATGTESEFNRHLSAPPAVVDAIVLHFPRHSPPLNVHIRVVRMPSAEAGLACIVAYEVDATPAASRPPPLPATASIGADCLPLLLVPTHPLEVERGYYPHAYRVVQSEAAMAASDFGANAAGSVSVWQQLASAAATIAAEYPAVQDAPAHKGRHLRGYSSGSSHLTEKADQPLSAKLAALTTASASPPPPATLRSPLSSTSSHASVFSPAPLGSSSSGGGHFPLPPLARTGSALAALPPAEPLVESSSLRRRRTKNAAAASSGIDAPAGSGPAQLARVSSRVRSDDNAAPQQGASPSAGPSGSSSVPVMRMPSTMIGAVDLNLNTPRLETIQSTPRAHADTKEREEQKHDADGDRRSSENNVKPSALLSQLDPAE